jgi:hypothetical protein
MVEESFAARRRDIKIERNTPREVPDAMAIHRTMHDHLVEARSDERGGDRCPERFDRVHQSKSGAFFIGRHDAQKKKSDMLAIKKATNDALGEALVSVVEELIAKEPYDIDGLLCAAQPQTYF